MRRSAAKGPEQRVGPVWVPPRSFPASGASKLGLAGSTASSREPDECGHLTTAGVVVPHRLLRRLAAGRVDDGLAAKAGVWQRRSTLRRTVREPDRRHPPPRHSFRRTVGRAAGNRAAVARGPARAMPSSTLVIGIGFAKGDGMRRWIVALAAVLIAALLVTTSCGDDGAESDGRPETEDGGGGY